MTVLDLLSGDAQTFLDKVWASRPHVHRTDPGELTGLLGLADVDHLLTETAIRTPAVRLAQDGTVLPASRYTRSATLAGSPLTGLVDARKVLDLFEGGASVVLQGLHRYWPPLTRLVADLEAALGHPCQANAYLTPPGSQGFARHSDTHDVFVFQTHGRKQWEVEDDGGTREVLLEPGVVMYLPTGTPHAARTRAEASLHVTVGINQLTWGALLRRRLDELLDSEEYGEHLPAGYLKDPGLLAEGLGPRLAALSAGLRDTDTAGLAQHQVERFLTRRAPRLGGGLTDRLALDDLHDRTLLHRRPGSVCELQPAGDRLRVLLGDRELRVPARLAEPLALVRSRAALRPADLSPWLDRDGRLVLCRRLVREGLLRVAA